MQSVLLESMRRSMYKESVHPYYFGNEGLVRFAGRIFAFDYDPTAKFFYAVLDIDLKNRPLFSLAYFFNWVKMNRRRYRFYFSPDVAFLLDGGWDSRKEQLFVGSPVSVGYFPVNYFNFVYYNNNFDKFSWTLRSMGFRYNFFYRRITNLLNDVDTHISFFDFSFISSFKKATYFGFLKYLAPVYYVIAKGFDLGVYADDFLTTKFVYDNPLSFKIKLSSAFFRGLFFLMFRKLFKGAFGFSFFANYLYFYSNYFYFFISKHLRFYFFYKQSLQNFLLTIDFYQFKTFFLDIFSSFFCAVSWPKLPFLRVLFRRFVFFFLTRFFGWGLDKAKVGNFFAVLAGNLASQWKPLPRLARPFFFSNVSFVNILPMRVISDYNRYWYIVNISGTLTASFRSENPAYNKFFRWHFNLKPGIHSTGLFKRPFDRQFKAYQQLLKHQQYFQFRARRQHVYKTLFGAHWKRFLWYRLWNAQRPSVFRSAYGFLTDYTRQVYDYRRVNYKNSIHHQHVLVQPTPKGFLRVLQGRFSSFTGADLTNFKGHFFLRNCFQRQHLDIFPAYYNSAYQGHGFSNRFFKAGVRLFKPVSSFSSFYRRGIRSGLWARRFAKILTYYDKKDTTTLLYCHAARVAQWNSKERWLSSISAHEPQIFDVKTLSLVSPQGDNQTANGTLLEPQQHPAALRRFPSAGEFFLLEPSSFFALRKIFGLQFKPRFLRRLFRFNGKIVVRRDFVAFVNDCFSAYRRAFKKRLRKRIRKLSRARGNPPKELLNKLLKCKRLQLRWKLLPKKTTALVPQKPVRNPVLRFSPRFSYIFSYVSNSSQLVKTWFFNHKFPFLQNYSLWVDVPRDPNFSTVLVSIFFDVFYFLFKFSVKCFFLTTFYKVVYGTKLKVLFKSFLLKFVSVSKFFFFFKKFVRLLVSFRRWLALAKVKRTRAALGRAKARLRNARKRKVRLMKGKMLSKKVELLRAVPGVFGNFFKALLFSKDSRVFETRSSFFSLYAARLFKFKGLRALRAKKLLPRVTSWSQTVRQMKFFERQEAYYASVVNRQRDFLEAAELVQFHRPALNRWLKAEKPSRAAAIKLKFPALFAFLDPLETAKTHGWTSSFMNSNLHVYRYYTASRYWNIEYNFVNIFGRNFIRHWNSKSYVTRMILQKGRPSAFAAALGFYLLGYRGALAQTYDYKSRFDTTVSRGRFQAFFTMKKYAPYRIVDANFDRRVLYDKRYRRKTQPPLAEIDEAELNQGPPPLTSPYILLTRADRRFTPSGHYYTIKRHSSFKGKDWRRRF